jgi:capsular exopolysaccharide synthesis family protein
MFKHRISRYKALCVLPPRYRLQIEMIPSQQNQDLNFHDGSIFMSVARKHLRLMALIMCLALVIGLILCVYIRPVFYARSLVRLEIIALPLDTAQNNDAHRGMVIRELTQAHILERTATRLGISTVHNDLRKKYLSNIMVRARSGSDLEVGVWAYSKEWAKNWTEALVQEYLEFRHERHDERNGETIKPLSTEAPEVSETSEPSIANLPLEIARLNQRIDEMSRVRINLQDPKLDVVAKLSLVSSLDKSVNLNASGAGAGPKSAMWETLEREQRAIKSQILNVSRIDPSGHAQLLAFNKKLERIDQELELELQGALERFAVDYQNLLDRKSVSEARLPAYNEFRRNNAKLTQKENLRDSGQLAGNPMVYKTSGAIGLEKKTEGIRLTYVGLQQLDDQPVWPRRLKFAVFSLVFGSVLAVGVSFVSESCNRRTTNLERVEMTFQLRGLGTIPALRGRVDYPPLLERDDGKRTALAENFEIIRTNLLSIASFTKVPQVTMITSARPNEGKTLVSSNLAAAFAQVGDRTLLIDTDLRRGHAHRLFGYRRAPGLSNVLLDELPIEEAIRPTAQRNHFVLTAGRQLDTGPEILGSARFADLMAQLREKYDRIIIDTPPVLGLSETLVLQRHVDGVLFVIRGGHTSFRIMKGAIETLQSSGANFYGFVLNRLNLNGTTNHYFRTPSMAANPAPEFS